VKDIQEIAPGVENPGQPLEYVATAGQPEEEHLSWLAEAGYKTVIDLRTSEEDPGFDEPGVVRQAGMEYVNIPVGHETIEEETFERFREFMRNPERRPVLVHCSSANRVGALLVPYLVLDEGKSTEEAEEVASGVGLKSDELKEAALKYVNERQEG
jgi:protein tyrosine phosphatase (PTP) superfamily phosphohydrolase (DUF442 family)